MSFEKDDLMNVTNSLVMTGGSQSYCWGAYRNDGYQRVSGHIPRQLR